MKQKTTFGFIVLTLCILSFTFVAYSNEGDIPIEQLSGFWYVGNNNPNIVVEGSKKHTFTPTDERHGICDIYLYDAFSGISATTNSYIVSQSNALITPYKAGNEYCHRKNPSQNSTAKRCAGKSPLTKQVMSIAIDKNPSQDSMAKRCAGKSPLTKQVMSTAIDKTLSQDSTAKRCAGKSPLTKRTMSTAIDKNPSQNSTEKRCAGKMLHPKMTTPCI